MGVVNMNPFLAQYYTKSIRLTPDGFSLFAVSDGNLVRRDFPGISDALISTQAPAFFALEEGDIQPLDVVVSTSPTMLIPDEIYRDEKAVDYLRMQFDISHIGHHFSDQVSHYRALYFLTQNEYDTINGLRCLPNFVSEASLLYHFLTEQGKGDCMLLSVNDSFADIIVLRQGEPSLVNRITRMENVDILYYTLNCVMQFGLSDPTFFVHYFTKPNKKLNELLGRYHSNVTIL